MKKHIIWSSYCDYEDWRYDLEHEYPDLTEDELVELMYSINDEYLWDERDNLDISLNEDIIILADLGLWNGRHYGYKELNSNNISDCLRLESCDYMTWYVDGYKNLCCTGIHHDGTNFYTYRMWKEGLSDIQKENFLNKIYEGKCTSRDISRYTRRIGDYIQEVYGWE